MEVFQIIIILFAIFALSRAFLRMRERQVTLTAFTFWTIVWGFLIFLAFWPRVLDSIAQIIGISSGTNLLVILGVILLFYLIFRMNVKINKLEKEISKIVSKIAIEKKSTSISKKKRIK